MVSDLLNRFLAVMSLAVTTSPVSGCQVSSTSMSLDRQPIYIQDNVLAYPQFVNSGSYLTANTGGLMVLACPGSGNVVVGGSQTENTYCVQDSTFLVQGVPADLSRVNCTASSKSAIVQTSRTCGPTGSRVIEVGFQLSRWYKLFETCHDNAGTFSAFARHRVSALTVLGGQKDSTRPAFKKGLSTVYQGIDPDALYKKTNQESMLYNYYQTDEYFDSVRLFLSKGHLAPDADFIFNPWQYATYYYSNTAPQWFGLNSGNWLAVERTVRYLADDLEVDLEVATGTWGILELADVNGNMKPLYLDPSKAAIPVPRLFWKAVYDQESDAAIVFLMENNPFVEGTKICTDVCADYGYSFSNSLSRGNVYCCTTDDLAQTIPYLPFASAAFVLEWV